MKATSPNDQVDGLRHPFRRQIADIGALENDDAANVPEPPVELTAAHVHRKDPRRAARQKHVREAARGRADVQADQPFGVDTEVVEPMGQLGRRRATPKGGRGP